MDPLGKLGPAESLAAAVDGCLLVGLSPAFERLRNALIRAAAADWPVLVSGEPGTGRSLIARALHEFGPRSGHRSWVIPASSFDEAPVPGALGLSARWRPGRWPALLREASEGTVILEELEGLSERNQRRLERYLSGRGAGTAGIGPRIVVTGSALMNSPESPPLWRRLMDHELRVPTLRERPSDIPLLVRLFAASGELGAARVVFSAEAMTALAAYPWPGNVAQLQTVVQRIVRLKGSGAVRASDLPVGIRPNSRRHPSLPSMPATTVADRLFEDLQHPNATFWSAVYPLFMRREITRADVRGLIDRGLAAAHGEWPALLRVLNVPSGQAGRFETFLRRYDCGSSLV